MSTYATYYECQDILTSSRTPVQKPLHATSASPLATWPLAGPVSLVLNGLSCARGDRTLFENVHAVVQAGQLLRVAGSNGAGKTTLLRAICGLLDPVDGEVLWAGVSTRRQRESFHRQLVYLGHTAALKPNLSALENLTAACGLAGVACSAAEASLALAEAGLDGVAHLPARALSQGQRRRATLARLALPARADDALLWVLDEPFNALDASATPWLMDRIERQLTRGGIVVLTSHQDIDFGPHSPQVTIAL